MAPNRGQDRTKFVHSGARGSQSVAAEVALPVRAVDRAATGRAGPERAGPGRTGLTPQNGASSEVIESPRHISRSSIYIYILQYIYIYIYIARPVPIKIGDKYGIP